METVSGRSLCSIALLVLGLLARPAHAADIKVISAGAVRGLIGGMIEDYAQRTGHRFDFKTGTTGQLRAIIASGEPADLIIASAPLMAELERSGKMMPGSRADLGRVGLGVAIRDGAVARRAGERSERPARQLYRTRAGHSP